MRLPRLNIICCVIWTETDSWAETQTCGDVLPRSGGEWQLYKVIFPELKGDHLQKHVSRCVVPVTNDLACSYT